MTARTRPWHIPMHGRDPDESHRASGPLELLVDLCFVVAVAQAAAVLHHQVVEGHVLIGAIGFCMAFFAIWWAWMNFTWFASAYDTDDVLYRLLTFVQMAGVLVIAAGIAAVTEHADLVVVTIGYVIMRVGLLVQWMRVSLESPTHRSTARRYAAGIGALQIGWIARLFVPGAAGVALIAPLVIGELLVPPWAERTGGRTPWHGSHIAERYGLFTIIVLGEVVLASTTAIREAIAVTGHLPELVLLAFGALVLIASMWWAYFKHDAAEGGWLSGSNPFAWGYGHYVVFASVAATSAGIQVVADLGHQEVSVGPGGGALAVAVPVVAYLLMTWFISAQPSRRDVLSIAVACAGVIAAALLVGPTSPQLAVLLMGTAVAAGVVLSSVRRTVAPAARPDSAA